MPFWRLTYHIIWATKNREHLLKSDLEENLFGYLRSKADGIGVRLYAINGWLDHVHLIVAIPPGQSVADVVKRLKGASSHHLNQMIYKGAFAWQRGYRVLSLGQRQLDVAQQYVQNQKQHHTHDTANPWLERCDDEEIEQNP